MRTRLRKHQRLINEGQPRQSVGKGCQKLLFPWALWLSKMDTVFTHGFEVIYPLHHSGVEYRAGTIQGLLEIKGTHRPRTLR